MIRSYEGIVIRQTKITGGRRMILVFTREEGKISCGTHISERSKGGAALAIRPFAYGHYTVSEKSAQARSISSAETLDAHFALGENADRYAEASYALEFTDKILPENAAAPQIFDLLKDYLEMLSGRKEDFRLLTISYLIKVMQELGVFPDTAVQDNGDGSLCLVDCFADARNDGMRQREPSPLSCLLPSGLNDDILNTIVYIAEQPLRRMDALTLDSEREGKVFGIIKAFAHEYMELGTIKSERMLSKESI